MIKLYGEAADDFLYESGITLYEDCIVLEGEQAEEYKRRKAEEKARKEKEEEERDHRRYDNDRYGNKYTSSNPNYKKIIRDALNGDDKASDRWDEMRTNDDRRMDDAAYKANKQYYNGSRPMNSKENRYAIDATNKHMRRHPEQYKESSIFDGVEFV